MAMSDSLLDAWRTHVRLSLAYLENVPPQALAAKAPAMGRTIGQIIAHMHNNRLAWLEPLAPELAAGLEKVTRPQSRDKELLIQSLRDSGEAVANLLQKIGAGDGRVKGFGSHVTSFLSYLTSHDAYHHGEVGISVTQLGYKMSSEASYALWDWANSDH